MEIIETTTVPVTCSQSSSSTGGTVGVAVALSLIIVALLIALGVLWRLYRRQKEIVGRKAQLYTTDSKPKGWYLVIFTKYLILNELTFVKQTQCVV